MLFTVGHGTRSTEELVAVLDSAGVRRLVDVHRFPGSRRNPHLSRDALEADALLRLLALPEPTAVMCAETLWSLVSHSARFARSGSLGTPWKCHRRLIADAALARGAEVVHLLGVGESQPHKAGEEVRVSDDGWPVYDAGVTSLFPKFQ